MVKFQQEMFICVPDWGWRELILGCSGFGSSGHLYGVEEPFLIS